MSFPRVSAPRAAWRLLRALLQLAKGLLIVRLRFAGLDAAGRQREIQRWSAGVLSALGVRLVVEGHPRPGAALVVANHVSWLDIAALHASCPQARFVSKADVLGWPVVGWLVRSVGTLFIERASKRDALRVVHQMAQALAQGDCVAVFPEGTTSDGQGVLPFHANLLQAAIAHGVPIQPAVLRYADPQHAVSPAAEFIGNTTLLQSLWNIVSARDLTVRVRWLPAQASAHADRRALAQVLQQQVEQGLLDL